jgi:hypothetical protein
MSRSSLTRRPFDDEVPLSTLVSYVPTTNLYSKNSVNITRDVEGRMSVVEVSDGFVKKTLTITRDHDGRITNIEAALTKV